MTRKVLSCIATCFLLSCSIYAQGKWNDELHCKNGNVIKGIITELNLNKNLKIQTADGNIFVYKMEEIESIQANPKRTSGDEILCKNGTLLIGVITELLPGDKVKIKTADGNIYAYKIEEVESINKSSKNNSINTNANNTKFELLEIYSLSGAIPIGDFSDVVSTGFGFSGKVCKKTNGIGFYVGTEINLHRLNSDYKQTIEDMGGKGITGLTYMLTGFLGAAYNTNGSFFANAGLGFGAILASQDGRMSYGSRSYYYSSQTSGGAFAFQVGAGFKISFFYIGLEYVNYNIFGMKIKTKMSVDRTEYSTTKSEIEASTIAIRVGLIF